MIDAWSGAKFNSIAFNASNAARRVFELKIDALHTIQFEFEWIQMIWKLNLNDFQVIVQDELLSTFSVLKTFIFITHNLPYKLLYKFKQTFGLF